MYFQHTSHSVLLFWQCEVIVQYYFYHGRGKSRPEALPLCKSGLSERPNPPGEVLFMLKTPEMYTVELRKVSLYPSSQEEKGYSSYRRQRSPRRSAPSSALAWW